ncbi:MAG: FHA domain-containing protein [Planctomycetaceae bacterium]
MSVILEITGNSATPEQFVLRAGEVAVVGRSPWVDLSLPEISDIADEHFEVDCRSTSCRVKSIDGPLLRNQVKIDSALLEDGDILRAGSVEFRVRLFGLTLAKGPGETIRQLDAGSTADNAFSQCLLRAGLSVDAQRYVENGAYLQTFDTLSTAGLTKDACRFAIAAMSPAEAITLSLQVLGSDCGLSPDDRVQLLEYAAGTNGTLTAEMIDQRMQKLPSKCPDAWIWKSARWLKGSLSPAGMPVVPPVPELFAVAMGVALALAAAQCERDVMGQWMPLIRERLLQNDTEVHPETVVTTRASA